MSEEACFGCGKKDVPLGSCVTDIYGFEAMLCEDCNAHDARYEIKVGIANIDFAIDYCIKNDKLAILTDYNVLEKLDLLRSKLTGGSVPPNQN